MATVSEALRALSHVENKCLVVKKRNEHDEYGLLLLSDVARKVLARDRAPDRVNVYEVMTKPVITSYSIHYTKLYEFAFALGFGTTVAEPALIAVAEEAAKVAADAGFIATGEEALAAYAQGLRFTVAASVGFAIVVGVLRIIRGWSYNFV